MFHKRKSETLVVGAGPVGLFAALRLAREGVGVELIDGQWRTAAHSYALALHPGALELLDSLGLADELVERGNRVDVVAFYDGADRRAEIRLGELGGEYPFVLVLPQTELEDALERELRERGVEVQWNHRLARLLTGDELPDDGSGDTVVAHVDRLAKEGGGYAYSTTNWVVDRSYEIRTGHVLGTDGHRSAVRRNLDLDYADLGGRSFFGVFELGADTEAHEVRVVIDDDTTNVLWPLGVGRFRWSFQLADDWQAVPRTRTKDRLAVSVGGATYPYLDEERLHKLLAERAPWFDADVEDVTWSIAVRFERRLAESFGRGRIWLAGDSAHMTGPVGVQSMNVGFREADRLARAVTAARRGVGDGDLLEAYGRESRREWLQLLGVEGGVRAGSGADDWVRRRAERILPCVPASGDPLRRLLGQLGLELG